MSFFATFLFATDSAIQSCNVSRENNVAREPQTRGESQLKFVLFAFSSVPARNISVSLHYFPERRCFPSLEALRLRYPGDPPWCQRKKSETSSYMEMSLIVRCRAALLKKREWKWILTKTGGHYSVLHFHFIEKSEYHWFTFKAPCM